MMVISIKVSIFLAFYTQLLHNNRKGCIVDSIVLIKMIEKDGWVKIAVRGSHSQFKHPTKKGRVTIPHPKKDLPKGTVQSILKQAKI